MTEWFVTQCCGITEIKNLSDSKTAEAAFVTLMGQFKERGGFKLFSTDTVLPDGKKLYSISQVEVYTRPFVVFSGTVHERLSRMMGHPHQVRLDGNYAQEFADYLLAHNLGEVSFVGEKRNFTTNTLRMYVWMPDWNQTFIHYKTLTTPVEVVATASSEETPDAPVT